MQARITKNGQMLLKNRDLAYEVIDQLHKNLKKFVRGEEIPVKTETGSVSITIATKVEEKEKSNKKIESVD